MIKFFAFFLAISNCAFADILFVDMNNSVSELTEARREARRRGENLIVVPNRNQTKPVSEQLEEVLFSQALSGDSFSTMIVSGHYGDGKFYGENHGRTQNLRYSELATIMRDPMIASIRNGVDTLILWGCYTARPRAISDWQGLFPQTQMIAGFNFAAPSSNTIASPRMMRNVLKTSYDNINDRRLVSRMRDFINATEGNEQYYDIVGMTNPVFITRGCYISPRIGNIPVSRLVECPPSMIERLIMRRRRSYDPFVNANSSDPEIRRRARSSTESGLYRFKIDSLRYGACFGMSSQLPSTDEVISLCNQLQCD